MKNYFKPKEVKLSLCKCDIDILLYAIYHVDWSEYDAEDFGGEDEMSAIIHLDDIENQLIDSQEINCLTIK